MLRKRGKQQTVLMYSRKVRCCSGRSLGQRGRLLAVAGNGLMSRRLGTFGREPPTRGKMVGGCD